MKGKLMNIATVLRWLLLAMTLAGGAAQAEDFYKGKTIIIAIGTPPGGVYDIYARLFVRHLGSFIPGNPNVIAQNMPGAAGMRVANYLYNAAPKDGTFLAVSLNNIPLNEFLSPNEVKYHSEQFTWIGRSDAPARVLFTWSASGIRTIADAKKREVLTAVTAPGTATEMYPSLANSLLGTRFKLINGYDGAAGTNIALERGEIEAVGANSWINIAITKPEWIQEHKISPLFQMTFARDPTLPPNTPTFLELVSSERDRDIVRLLTRIEAIGFYLMGPPEIPAERAEILRRAFAAMVASPDFVTDAKILGAGINPMGGDDLQKLVSDILTTPQDIVSAFKNAANPPH